MSNFGSGYIKYVNNLEQINDAAIEDPLRMIIEVEDSYREHLENIARNICFRHKEAKICMLAGPSSSGKTTSAHLLQKYLKNFGKNSIIVSLDDFYLNDEDTPFLPNGERDYECVESLDIKLIQNTLLETCTDGVITIPLFDFSTHTRVGMSDVIDIGEDDFVIVEGLHALNPTFTAKLPKEMVVKLYVSVRQGIEDVNGEVIAPVDLRLVRRIVRDRKFRSTTPEENLKRWASVRQGEEKYIRPYRLTADYSVNSIHIYEPCVLRIEAIPLLRQIPEDSEYYRKARELESKLMRFEPVTASLVPTKSMLREFIGAKYNFE